MEGRLPLAVQADLSEAVVKAPLRSGILIETGSQLQQLQSDEIAYLYSSGGIVEHVQPDGRVVTTNYDSLGAVADRLPKTWFFQINRRFIVHLNAVRTVSDDVNPKLIIQLGPALPQQQTDKGITISQYRSAEFRQRLTRAAQP